MTRYRYPRSQPTLPQLCAIAGLLLGSAGCTSKRTKLFGDVSVTAGTGGTGVGGTAAEPSGSGGYGFVDGLDTAGAAGSAGAGGRAADAGATDPYVLPPSVTLGDAGLVLCGSVVCACNNGVDDDSDGKRDGFDEECTGALDDDEGTFSTGIPGDNSDPKWQDCFFDGNSGAGDDHCRYHADCLTGDKPASDPDCAVSDACLSFCQVRTPNGCDCFGCCTVQLDEASSVSVFIGESCSLEDVADTARCPRCTPSTACGNTCGECELCPGKGIEDLPETCGGASPGGSGGGSSEPEPAYTCDTGQLVCGGAGECPAGQYCSLGCCLSFMIH
jgi:hypothetical protein